jgi:hypothetical protein
MPEESQHDEPLPGNSGASIDVRAPLNLHPPGDTGDLVARDVISVVAALLNDGSECFVLITTKGMRHAPATAHNRLVLSSLVSIRELPTLAEDGGDNEFAAFLLDAEIEGRFNEASWAMDQGGAQWLIVQAETEFKTFVFTDERYEALLDNQFVIHLKTKRNLSPALGL